MSPINQSTIKVVKLSNTKGGQDRVQIIAEGDDEDPGTFVFERGIYLKNINYIKAPGKIVDVLVNYETGVIINNQTVGGLWRKFKERG